MTREQQAREAVAHVVSGEPFRLFTEKLSEQQRQGLAILLQAAWVDGAMVATKDEMERRASR